MSAPDKIWVNLDDNTDGCCPVETDLDDVGKFFDASQATEYTRSDLIQSAVAAALEAAATGLDNESAALDADALRFRGGSDANYTRQVKAHTARMYAGNIRALINPAQHDALAAHVAAAVANARAEDAAKIDGSAGVRIQDVAQYLIDHMPAYNSEHPCWEALQDANDDGADEDDCIRAWLRSIAQIGAKP